MYYSPRAILCHKELNALENVWMRHCGIDLEFLIEPCHLLVSTLRQFKRPDVFSTDVLAEKHL